MEYSYHIDEIRLELATTALLNRIKHEPSQGNVEIAFDNGYFRSTEWYKYGVYLNARNILDVNSWTEEMIGTHVIGERVIKALSAGKNLIYFMTNDFADKIASNVIQAERILYDMYKANDEENDRKAFEQFIKFFGRNYSRTAYLFFLKDKDKYLPLKPDLFKKWFSLLDIRTECCSGCTWNHYMEFIQIIKEVRDHIQPNFRSYVSLLDAHSFVWCMHLLEEALESAENDFRDYSDGRICVSEEQWKALLADESVFPREYLNLLGRFYIADNHSATATDLAREDGIHTSSYNPIVASMGKRVTEQLSLPTLYRENGQSHYWPVLFYGRRLISGLFEWQMRPELVKAFQEVCSDVVFDVKNKADQKEAEDADDDILLKKAQKHSEHCITSRRVTVEQKYRDPYIAEWAKRRANGICLLCGEAAPFEDINGKPYLEAHHVDWLSEGGADSIDNVVALCPNCHKKLHIRKGSFDEIEARQFLKDCLADYINRERNNGND